MPIPLNGKRCPKGYHRDKPKGTVCVPAKKRANGTPLCPSMKELARKWKKNTNDIQSKFKSKGNKTAWNAYVAHMRKNCKK